MHLKNLFKVSLLKKFLVAFLLAALIPLGIAEYRTMIKAEEELKTLLNEEYYLIIDQVRLSMDEGNIYQWISGMRNLALMLENIDSDDQPMQRTVLDTYLKMVDELVVLEFKQGGGQSPMVFMKNEFINELFVQDGNAVSALFEFSGEEPSIDANLAVKAPLFMETSSKIFLPVEFPVTLNNGEVTIVRGVFDIDAILGLISREISTGHRELYIIDTRGEIIYENKNGRFNSGEILPYAITENVRKCLEGQNRAFQLENFQYEQKALIGNYTVSSYIDWAIVVVDEFDMAYALVAQVKKDIVVWVTIAVILCVLFSLFFARSFSKTIAYLAAASKKIGDGDLEVKIKVPSRDEIGQLAESLQDMVNSLRDAVKVREKLITIEQEVKIAGRIQQSILPVGAPHIEGLNFDARYIPMAGVAGDFYDYHVISETKLGVLVADVSGHGIPAALISAMVKIAFSQQKHIAEDPGAVLKAMNQTLVGKMEDQFLTASYLYIDLESKKLVLADAGHLPLLIWRKAEQKLLHLKPKGMLMGWMADINFPVLEMDFQIGDRMIMYTDGIVEAHSPQEEQFNEERFVDLIREGQDIEPAELVQKVVDSLTTWVNSDEGFEDDITITVIDVLNGQRAKV